MFHNFNADNLYQWAIFADWFVITGHEGDLGESITETDKSFLPPKPEAEAPHDLYESHWCKIINQSINQSINSLAALGLAAFSRGDFLLSKI